MRPIGGAGVLALALALAGCGGEREAAAAIPRARFVAANVALRSIPDSAADAAALREAALKKHRVNEKQLKDFVDAHNRDPEYIAGVWREIAQKVDSAYERTLAARDGGERPAPSPDPSGVPGAPGTPGASGAPGVVGQPQTLEPPPEMPPPPGSRMREIIERENRKKPPLVGDPQQPRQLSPPEGPPPDARRPSRPIPPPLPDSVPRP